MAQKYQMPNYYFIEENDYSAEKSHSPPGNQSQAYFQGSASQGSYVESMTPQRMNRIVDWSRSHVTPGDSKNIFPQVIAPSIEFSNDNSVSLNLNSMHSSHKQLPVRNHLFLKKQESPIYSDRKTKQLSQELSQLYDELKSKTTMVNALRSQYKEAEKNMINMEAQHKKELDQAIQMQRALREKFNVAEKEIVQRDNYIGELTEQIQIMKKEFNDLQQRLESEKQGRIEDAQIMQQFKQKEEMFLQKQFATFDQTQQQTQVNVGSYEDLQRECLAYKKQVQQLKEKIAETNPYMQLMEQQASQGCSKCDQCFETIRKILQECYPNEDTEIDRDMSPEKFFRGALTMLLESQRDCLRDTLGQLEAANQELEQNNEGLMKQVQDHQAKISDLTNKLTYFNEQNQMVIEENNRISEQIQMLLQEKDNYEEKIFAEFDKAKKESDKVLEQLKQERNKNIELEKQILETKQQQLAKLSDNQILQTLKEENKQLLEQLQAKQQEQKENMNQINLKMDQLKQEKENDQQKIKVLQEQSKNKESSKKKHQLNYEKFEKIIQQLGDEKKLLQSKIQELEQRGEAHSAVVKQDERLEKNLREKEKKNIELYNQVKQIQTSNKSLEEQVRQLKEEGEKQKTHLQNKTQQIKTLMDQIKQLQEQIKQYQESNHTLQEQNQELSERLNALSEQVELFEQGIQQGILRSQPVTDSNRLDMSPQLERLTDRGPDPQVVELHQQIVQYEQEFKQIKKVLTDRISQQEQINRQLAADLDQLRQENVDIVATYEYVIAENHILKQKLLTLQQDHMKGLSPTTLDEAIGRTQDSLNLRSFLGRKTQNEQEDESVDNEASQKKGATNIFQQHLTLPTQTITDLVQPEMLSVEDTIALVRDVLHRAVKSAEVMRSLMEIQEIRDLLATVAYVDDRLREAERSDPQFQVLKSHNFFQKNKSRLLSSIILNSNLKSIMGSETSDQRKKISHRSHDRRVIEFIDS